MKPIIIIPTYNEVDNLRKLILEVRKNLEGREFGLLIVDDNSTDGTLESIQDILDNNTHILKRPGKQGLATAYIQGIKYAIELGYDAFIEFDADFSHNPKYLPEMFEKLNTHDLVIGSRNIKGGSVVGWGFVRNFISKGGSLYSRIVLGCPIYDLTGGFNAWRKEIIEKINLDSIISKGYCFQIEMKYKAFLNDAKIIEIPIVFEDRRFGQSKMDKSIFIEALFNILKLRFQVKK
ncbi:polyprenol monophosphomannose synthase [bacterium]|nr:polyprenol monophosphomannose synthase [bacterium]